MSEPFVYDPRYPLCKAPFGAVKTGETVTFRCRPLASEGFTHCTLVLHREFAQMADEVELKFMGREKDGRLCFGG